MSEADKVDINVLRLVLDAERSDEDAERKRLERDVNRITQRYEKCEEEVLRLTRELSEAKAGRSVAEQALATESAARAETERRCTYLIEKMTAEEEGENALPGYRITNIRRDGNGDMVSADLIPKEK